MGKYLKLFDNHNGYTAYTADTENYLLPNVSYCIEQDECHFNPYNEPSQGLVLLTTYSVSSAEPTCPLYLHLYRKKTHTIYSNDVPKHSLFQKYHVVFARFGQ